jgi:hypothetical protein
MRSNVKFVATKKACRQRSRFAQLTRAVGELLDRTIAAREIRDAISPEDFLRAFVGMCYMHDQPGWQTSVLCLSTSSSKVYAFNVLCPAGKQNRENCV